MNVKLFRVHEYLNKHQFETKYVILSGGEIMACKCGCLAYRRSPDEIELMSSIWVEDRQHAKRFFPNETAEQIVATLLEMVKLGYFYKD